MIFSIIVFSIALVLLIPSFWLVMRYQVHMFQQNGYKNNEHFKWLFRKQNLQSALFGVQLLGMFAITDLKVLHVVFPIVLVFIIWGYLMMKKMKAKKKLVFTARVKRLIATDCILNALIIGIVLCLCAACSGWFAADTISAEANAMKAAGESFFSAGLFTAGKILAAAVAVTAVLAGIQPLTLIVVNMINSPIEKGIGRHFINDAKRMLADMPNLQIIGVTGSYGKTSVKYFLSSLLKTKYDVLITPESFNTPMGVVRTVREHLKSTHEIFVCEMGARNVGDIKELCDIVHPVNGVITSVGPQHLETFHTIENVVNTKFELADSLPREGGATTLPKEGCASTLRAGVLFLNGDNELIRKKSTEYADVIFYGTTVHPGEYYADDIKLTRLGTSFVMVTPDGERTEFQTKLIGSHNVINIVGAIAIAHEAGIAMEELRVPVRRLQPVEHRLQMLERGSVTIIDDAYNSNPVGSKSAVETLALFEGVRILITPGMVELGAEEERYNYEFGTYAAKCCDYVALVGSKRAEPIKKGLLDAGFPEAKLRVCERLEDAMSFAGSINDAGHKYILLENDLPDNY